MFCSSIYALISSTRFSFNNLPEFNVEQISLFTKQQMNQRTCGERHRMTYRGTRVIKKLTRLHSVLNNTVLFKFLFILILKFLLFLNKLSHFFLSSIKVKLDDTLNMRCELLAAGLFPVTHRGDTE